MDRVTQFAVAAAKLAVDDAKLDLEKINPVRAGVCVGSGIGGIHTFLEQSLKYGEKGIIRALTRAQQGDVETGLVFTGANMWKIKEILPVKEIFRRLKDEIAKI